MIQCVCRPSCSPERPPRAGASSVPSFYSDHRESLSGGASPTGKARATGQRSPSWGEGSLVLWQGFLGRPAHTPPPQHPQRPIQAAGVMPCSSSSSRGPVKEDFASCALRTCFPLQSLGLLSVPEIQTKTRPPNGRGNHPTAPSLHWWSSKDIPTFKPGHFASSVAQTPRCVLHRGSIFVGECCQEEEQPSQQRRSQGGWANPWAR